MARKAGSAAKDAADAKTKSENGTGKKRGRPPKVHKDLSEGDSQVSETVFLNSVATLEKLNQLKDTAVANIRAHRKHCDGLGINLKAMDTAMRAKKMAEDLRFGYMRDADRYLKYLRVPTGTQFGLFEQELPLDEEGAIQKAYDDGVFASREGKGSTSNPHLLNTARGQSWLRGWSDDQAATIKRMGEKRVDGTAPLPN